MAYTTIDDGSAHFQTVIWTGNDSNPRTISHGGNSDMQPDLLWHKLRSGILSHMMYDSSRGVGKRLHPDQTSSEITQADTGTITAFTSDGFTVDAGTTNDLYVNDGSRTYVSWGWKANGGTTASNTDGSITSTVQANTTAGFSIVTYTGNGTEGATFGHGLGATPDLVIVKGRGDADNWAVFNGTSTTASRSLHLDTADAEIPVSSYNFWNLYWDETRPSSTVVTLGVDSKVNKNSGTKVAYCFRSIQGYSKIGKYTGNADANGVFVYTGFKPAWLMVKRTDSSQNWIMYDNKRNDDAPAGANVIDRLLYANDTDAEVDTGSSLMVDFLSNGFKMRGTHAASNGAGVHVYMAFAEHPFVSSEGVPTTAR